MAKIKSSEIPHYELLYLVSNKYSEDELEPIIEKVNKIIKNNGGNITLIEEWGKKRLAYMIKHFRYGYYNLVEFDLPGEEVAKIDRELRMASEILRHQIVKRKIKTPQEIEKDEQIARKIATRKAKEEKVIEEKEKAKDKDKEKIKLKDLDEKLDKILETEDLL